MVGPLVEMLAAVPSIISASGARRAGPVRRHLEPGLHSALGFIPLFGPPADTGSACSRAGLVLTLMILPIISALSRDLFLTVPRELKDGAAALGATRWEIIRGIVLPSTASGVGAAIVLGLGRALGEAIAVSLVIGDVNRDSRLAVPARRHAGRADRQPVPGRDQHASHRRRCSTPALILLVIGMITSLAARAIAGRFDVNRASGGV